MSHIQITSIEGPDKGQSYKVEEGGSLLVGRGEKSDTRIDDKAMSRGHFKIYLSDGEIAIEDQQSRSGTFLNGNEIHSSLAKIGDRIQAGDTTFKIEGQQQAGATTIHSSPRIDINNLVGKNIGDFQIESLIAKGSNGLIFKALDTKKNRVAAMKVLFPHFVRDEQQQERFVRAMKTMINFKHPHIVELYAAGKSSGLCYAAMEYIDGEDLSKLIDRMGIDGVLDWAEVWRCAVQITRALDAGYYRHVIHRNVTPTNIIRRSSDKSFKLIDLMLAKALEGVFVQQITQPGQLLGELHYLPPERTVEDTNADTRSDIYGLGATCYALLTGKPPASGKSLVEILKSIRNDAPELPSKKQPDISKEFEALVMQMLAKDPGDRFSEPADLLKKLEGIKKSKKLEADAADWWVG